MIYPYSASPYMQNPIALAIQAIMSGGPLPPNCFVTTIPIQQAQQMFPHIIANYGIGAGPFMYNQQSAYYGQIYQPQFGQYPYNPFPQPQPPPPPPSNVIVPYTNYPPPQVYEQNYNYPVVPYDYSNNHGSSKKHRHAKRNSNVPHSNVYNSSSFDSDMRNLSWSRLFAGQNHRGQSKHHSSNQTAISYNNKGKHQNDSSDTFTTTTTSSSSDSGSTSTTSDETIRRVNVMKNQQSAPSTASKQQTKGSLPFKYSSEFVPGNNRHQHKSQKSTRKESKVRTDDVFVIRKS